jgi:hypothetical protein
MKILTLALLVLLASPQSDTSALVEASKKAKSKRKTSTTKVITNEDVKKSKGKIVERPGTPQPDPAPEPTETEKYEAARAARIEREANIAAAEKLVAELTAALEKIEQAYYDENDLDRRDTVIVKQFEETKKKLDEAQAALEASRGTAEPEEPRNR